MATKEKADGRARGTIEAGPRGGGEDAPAGASKGRPRRGIITLAIAAAIFSLAALYLYADPERAGALENRFRALRVTGPLSPDESPVLAAQGIAGINPLADPFSGGAPDGGLSLSLEEGTRLFIDGEYIGTAPFPGAVRLPPGRHLVELRRAGFADWSGEVEVRPGETIDFRAVLSPL